MTVSSTTRRAGPYATNGAQTAFPFAFKVFNASDVVATTSADGVDTTLAYGTGYSVSLNADQDATPGGTVSISPALNGPTVTLTSNAAYEQPAVFTNQGGFYPRVLNDSLDRLTIYVQQLAEKIGRAALRTLGTPVPGKYLVTDANGDFTYSDGTGNDAALRNDLAQSGGSGLVGFQQSGTGAVARTVRDKARDVVSVKDFGAVGDGVTDDYAAIILARDYAHTTGKALHFPDGVYAYGTRPEFGYPNLEVTFGGRVTLKPTHAGAAVSIDGGATSATSVFGVQFGVANMPTIQGNAGTTVGLYTRGCHHARIRARLRDCATGHQDVFSVCSEFDINFSANQGGWTIQNPTKGITIEKRETAEATTGSTWRMVVEGISGLGLDLIDAQHCNFYGTSEGNTEGGVRIRSNSNNNIFFNFFCEQNGTAPHWQIEGNDNTLLNCTSGGASNTGTNTTVITGVRNLFVRGKWHNLTSGGFYNEFRQVALSGTYTSNPLDIREKCHDGAGTEIKDIDVTSMTLKGVWVGQVVNGERAHGYFKDKSGVVHFVGAVKSGTGSIFDMPAGFRPGGTIYRPYYNVTAGTSGVIAITAGGDLQHVSGDTGTVDLSQMSYLAEG